jgi:tetratricopeptide (TPR) repeat protein
LIFPAILFVYLLLLRESDWRTSARRCMPALLVSASMAILQARMTPASFLAGAASAYQYRITQPFVALHYCISFFLPLWLTADTDMRPFASILDARAMLGFTFVVSLLVTSVACARRREMRPVAFGLFWFLLALVPTSVFPLAEVENDHRMFFPFVGLVMSVVWAVVMKIQHRPGGLCHSEAAAAVVLLIAFGFGTWKRNQVWRTEESLWHDVTIKSLSNGRGLMNYGLTQMSKGDYHTALLCFQRALDFTPAYPLLEVNLGIANEGLGRGGDAERHFARAMWLAPNDPQVRSYCDRAEHYLSLSLLYHQAGQYWQSIGAAQEALRRRPDYAEAYNNIAAAYESLGMWNQAIEAAQEALRIRPDFQLARNNLAWAEVHRCRKSPVPP